jgi:hypothetical protein
VEWPVRGVALYVGWPYGGVARTWGPVPYVGLGPYPTPERPGEPLGLGTPATRAGCGAPRLTWVEAAEYDLQLRLVLRRRA